MAQKIFEKKNMENPNKRVNIILKMWKTNKNAQLKLCDIK
jgi:hypothetical protein